MQACSTGGPGVPRSSAVWIFRSRTGHRASARIGLDSPLSVPAVDLAHVRCRAATLVTQVAQQLAAAPRMRCPGDRQDRVGQLRVREVGELEGQLAPGPDLDDPRTPGIYVVVGPQVLGHIPGQRIQQQTALPAPVGRRLVVVLGIGQDQEPCQGPVKGHAPSVVAAQHWFDRRTGPGAPGSRCRRSPR